MSRLDKLLKAFHPRGYAKLRRWMTADTISSCVATAQVEAGAAYAWKLTQVDLGYLERRWGSAWDWA